MRRLWSHIAIAATSLLMVGATFATVVTNINSNIEFTKGREVVFRVSKKDSDGNVDKDYTFDNDETRVGNHFRHLQIHTKYNETAQESKDTGEQLKDSVSFNLCGLFL